MLWIELVLVLLTAFAGRSIAARLPRAWWMAGVTVPALLLVLIFAAHRIAWLQVFPPFSWLTDENIQPPLMACGIVVLFSTLIARLNARRTQVLAAGLTAVLVAYHSVIPLAMPLALRSAFAGTTTRLNPDGVCLQTQKYSCGPAAAVTCLRALGVAAEEGELTIESRCQPPLGVEAPSLAAAITALYGSQGITADCRWFASVDQLPSMSVASLQRPDGVGHAVAVLGVSQNAIVVGDPALGICRMPRAAFLKLWTGVAIVLRRDMPDSNP